MANVFASLLPVFALIILGSLLKFSNMFPRTVWSGLENLVYWVLLPALLVVKLGNAPLDNFDVLPMGGAMAASVILAVIGLCVIRSLFEIKQKSFTSVLQGAIRQNSYIGLAAAGPLYGVTGEALVAVCIAAVIPLVNVISLWSLLKIGNSKKVRLSMTELKTKTFVYIYDVDDNLLYSETIKQGANYFKIFDLSKVKSRKIKIDVVNQLGILKSATF